MTCDLTSAAMLAAAVLSAVLYLTSASSRPESLRAIVSEACGAPQAQSLASIHSRLDYIDRTLVHLANSVTAVSNRQQELTAQLGTVATRLNSVLRDWPPDRAGVSDEVSEQHRGLAEQLADLSGRVEGLSASCAAAVGPPRRRLGDNCGSDGECDADVSHSVCRGGVCACGEDAAEDGGRCRPYPRLAQPCRDHHECAYHTANAECAAGVCACAAGFVVGGSECRPLVAAGSACSCQSDCSPSRRPLSCRGGRCGAELAAACLLTAGRWLFQLAGGDVSDGCRAGRLLVPVSGRWWQLCDSGPWTDADAAVTCRQLGFEYGTAVTDGRYGNGGPARVLNIACTGTEFHLGECDEGVVSSRAEGGCPEGATPVTVECFGRQSPGLD